MTEAVCFKCGALKWGAFTNCKNCGARPTSDDDLMLSLACTDHFFDHRKLEQIGRDIRAGQAPQLDPATRETLIPEIREAKVLLGIDRTAKQQVPSGRRVFYSPAALGGRSRQWKIALSLAVVGALAAPFVFHTYKARPVSAVWVPLTAHDKEQRANYLDTNDCKSFDNNSSDELFCYYDLRTGEKDFKRRIENELEWGTRRGGVHADLLQYLAMNVGVAAATAFSLFGLAYLIPMLIRGVVFLARRCWRWLNA